jgi:uncharacterized protein (UPF0332 family)
MTLASDLLAQAKHLASRERGRPRQASLRRAASAAYYALFHLLIREASRRLVRDTRMQGIVSRVFIHTEMSKASRSFSGGTLPQKYVGVIGGQPLPLALRNVANAFVELQQARHEADYNVAKSFSRAEVRSLIDQAEQAFQDWQTVRRTTAGRLYLVCLLLWERLDKIK